MPLQLCQYVVHKDHTEYSISMLASPFYRESILSTDAATATLVDSTLLDKNSRHLIQQRWKTKVVEDKGAFHVKNLGREGT